MEERPTEGSLGKRARTTTNPRAGLEPSVLLLFRLIKFRRRRSIVPPVSRRPRSALAPLRHFGRAREGVFSSCVNRFYAECNRERGIVPLIVYSKSHLRPMILPAFIRFQVRLYLSPIRKPTRTKRKIHSALTGARVCICRPWKLNLSSRDARDRIALPP